MGSIHECGPNYTVVVAQLVRAPDCGSGGRRFETDLPPLTKSLACQGTFFYKVIGREVYAEHLT